MVADGDGVFDVEGGLGVVQDVGKDGGDQKFPAGHFTGEAKAGQAFFDAGFEVGEAIEGALVLGQLQRAALEGDAEVGEDVLRGEVEFEVVCEGVGLVGVDDWGFGHGFCRINRCRWGGPLLSYGFGPL